MTYTNNEDGPLARTLPLGEIIITKHDDNGFSRAHPDHRSQKNIRGSFEANFESIDFYLAQRNVSPTADSRYEKAKKIFKSVFFAGMKPVDYLVAPDEVKYAITDFIQMKAIVENYTHLRKLPLNLHTAFFKDPLMPNGSFSQGRNFLFEHYIGARFSAAGCEVRQAEPDFICMRGGERFGVAAKKLKICNLERRISKAKKQIMGAGFPGIIVLDLSADLLDSSVLFYQNNYDEYISNVHRSMQENFYGVLRRQWERWGLIRTSIPAVIAFHIGAYFDHQMQMVRLVTHTSTFLTGPDLPMAAKDEKSYNAIMKTIENMQVTLVDSDSTYTS
jgi:hypothetical protein